MLVSGGLAGLAGMFEATGTLGQLTTNLSPGYGFTAIIVAFLGRLNPLGVIPAGSAAGAVLSRRRRGADQSRPAQRGHRHLPGHPAVLPAGLRRAAAAPHPLAHHPQDRERRVMTALLIAFLVSVIAASTPLLLAAVGELVVEKAGVLNLGVEGMMLGGAIAAFAAAHETGQPWLGMLAGAGRRASLLSLMFGVISLTLQANQTATGLALTIFGRGFSALLGAGYVGIPAPTLPKLHIPVLSDIPVLGPVLFAAGLPGLSLAGHAGASWPGASAAHASRPDHARRRRLARCGAFARLSGAADPLLRGDVRRRAGRAGRRLHVARLHADVGAGHDGRARLGGAGAGHLRRVAAVLAADRRLVLRRADVSVAVCAGAGRRRSRRRCSRRCPISAPSSCWC